MPTGYLMKDSDHKEDEKSDDTEGKKKNGNGNGSNGNGNGNGGSNGGSNGGGVSEAWSAKYKKSIDCDNPKGFSQKAHCRGRKIDEGKDGMSDHEVSMAKGQVRNSITNLKRVEKVLKTMTDKDDLPAWLQAKITDTEHNTDAAAGYMDEEVITEKRDGKSSKDKGYSLRDWFKGGGWKQTGGKYDGKPCAKQPGQKTKPYCRDADDRAAMSKKERNKRAAKKRREDPNPNKKGKAKNVRQESFSNWRQDLQEKPGDGYLGPTMNIGGKEYGVPNPIRIAKDAVDNTNRANQRKVDQVNKTLGRGSASISPYTLFNKQTSTASQNLFGMQKQSYEPEGNMVNEKSAFGDNRLRPYDLVRTPAGLKSLDMIDKEIEARKTKNNKGVKEEFVDEGKKDACYHKVKSRYSVWPSAYASGALVKCRKVGAKNWGNKSKKKNESYDLSNWRDDFQATEYESVDIIKAEPLQPTQGLGSEMLEAKSKKDRLKEISAQLKKASAMHAKQSKAVAKCADELTEAPIVEPSVGVAPKRPSMMQQAQDLRAMRMRSLQRQGKPLEVEKIRSTLPTAAVDASNQRARELDKIRRQSRDATIARASTAPAPQMTGTIRPSAPVQQKAQSIPAPKPDVVPPVNQAQKDAAAKLDDASLRRYNMDPKVVKPQPPAPVRPAATGGQDDVGTKDDNTKPSVVPLKVEPANQSADQIRQSAMNTVNNNYASSIDQQATDMMIRNIKKPENTTSDNLLSRMGYIKTPIGGGSYISPKQLRDMEREMATNKNYNPGLSVDNPLGYRKYFNPVTKKIELPEEVQLDEKCWKGYEKKGMKTMFGKRYPNCVKKKKTRKEEVELDEKKDPCWDTHEMKGMKKKGNRMVPNCVPKEQVSDWRSELNLQEKKKKNCGCGKDPCETYGKQDVKEDWQKANRKDKTDGMSQKAVNAYKKENPGSKLKTAVTGKVKKGSKDAKRRKSFCSRSNGQRKMHNIDCSKTPDKKICKARRRWKC